MRTLVTEQARLTLYDGLAHGELFDRINDPDETRNLFGLAEGGALQARHMEALVREMMAHSDRSPRPSAFA
ncbi:MAG: hypothetical protein ACI9W2_002292 [Gammaproteobacteria bacterium]|jgi:hypothetical protein